MSKRADYAIRKTVEMSYDQAVSRARQALQAEGFGVLTEIDIKAKLHEKLGVDFRRYIILGACNPPLAYKALQAELEIGLLLPCNVIVYEVDDKRSVVAALDPDAMMSVVEDDKRIREVAADAKVRLQRAIASV